LPVHEAESAQNKIIQLMQNQEESLPFLLYVYVLVLDPHVSYWNVHPEAHHANWKDFCSSKKI